jgi:phosphohistidine phosphatase
MAEPRTLVLLRHAKSSWDTDEPDHERPLAPRGRRDAKAVGQYLAAQGLRPDVVLCSTARRTRQTWDQAVKGGAKGGDVRYLDEIYDASVTELVEVLHDAPADARSILLLGHAPGIPRLMDYLAIRRSDSPVWERAEQDFPTSGLAVLELESPWSDIGEAVAELTAFEAPRG